MSWKDFKEGLDRLGKVLLWVAVLCLIARFIILKRFEISRRISEQGAYNIVVDHDPRY